MVEKAVTPMSWFGRIPLEGDSRSRCFAAPTESHAGMSFFLRGPGSEHGGKGRNRSGGSPQGGLFAVLL